MAGDGLAKGYLNQAQLTSEKFVEHSIEKGQLLYRTGDVARFRTDGNIEFMDRMDQQVKIRGHRIELGEIEKQLLGLEHVREATVRARENQSKKELCAYLVTDMALSANEIREQLVKFLPEFMVPIYYVRLEKMPLTPNGKLDLKALPNPDARHRTSKNDVGPRNETEGKLVGIWQEILDSEGIGIDDNFFEIGGHSLLIARVVGEINEAFDINLPLTKVFKTPTIRTIAAIIEEIKPEKPLMSTAADKQMILLKEGRGVNSAKHVFFIHAGNGDTGAYVPFSQRLSDEYQYWAIRSAARQDFEPSITSTEELAESYIKKIRAVQPEGPYYIAGWSVGGTIAFEMARQMEEMNLTVALLAMIDSPFVLDKEPQAQAPFHRDTEIQILRSMYSSVQDDPEIQEVLEIACDNDKLWSTFIQIAEQKIQQHSASKIECAQR